MAIQSMSHHVCPRTALRNDLLCALLPSARRFARPAQKAEVSPPRLSPTRVPQLHRPPLNPPLILRRIVWAFIKNHPNAQRRRACRRGHIQCRTVASPDSCFPTALRALAAHLLIADEVGLGKTIQAGMLIRQAWLAEKAQRVLILAPASVCRQWQLELREKFNLNWPIYDGDQLVGSKPLDATSHFSNPFQS